MFVSGILRAANLESMLSEFILYDRYSDEKKAIVSFSPSVHHPSGVQCCRVSIEASEAITLDDEFEDSNCPLALLAAESPHRVLLVNEDFLPKFQCTRSYAREVDFARFQGADQSSWIPLFDTALHG